MDGMIPTDCAATDNPMAPPCNCKRCLEEWMKKSRDDGDDFDDEVPF